MNLLDWKDADLFEEFWSKQTFRYQHQPERMKPIMFFILFGKMKNFQDDSLSFCPKWSGYDVVHKREFRGKRNCAGCHFVRDFCSEVSYRPNGERPIFNIQFYESFIKTLTDEYKREIARIIGAYRFQLFFQEFNVRHNKYAAIYNRTVEEIKRKEQVEDVTFYCEAAWIQENDNWGKFAQDKKEEEILCLL